MVSAEKAPVDTESSTWPAPAGPARDNLGRRFARLTFFNILANLTVPLAEFLAGVALFLGLTAGRTLRNSMVLSAGLYLPCALWAVHAKSAHLLWASFALFMVARTVTLGWADHRLADSG